MRIGNHQTSSVQADHDVELIDHNCDAWKAANQQERSNFRSFYCHCLCDKQDSGGNADNLCGETSKRSLAVMRKAELYDFDKQSRCKFDKEFMEVCGQIERATDANEILEGSFRIVVAKLGTLLLPPQQF